MDALEDHSELNEGYSLEKICAHRQFSVAMFRIDHGKH